MDVPAKKILENGSKRVVQPRRSQVYVGFGCHQGCGFCYYKDRCGSGMFEPDRVMAQIDLLLGYGIRDFEITGGEPSECSHLREYCAYIKDRSPDSRIAVITNGGLYASDVWDLIDEVLLSYHLGRDVSGADMSYFPKGCTYGKVVKTVSAAEKSGKLLRTNTVIGMFNVKALGSIIDDISGFNPGIVNFLPVNLFDGAKDQYSQIDYGVVGPALSEALDRLDERLPAALKFVRYIPFCALPEKESHIVGTYQHIFDWFDWNVELTGLRILNLINDPKALETLGPYGSTSFESAELCRASSYEKSPACLRCRYLYVCDGVERTPGHVLLRQVKPCAGIILKDISGTIGVQTGEFYERRYGEG